MKFKASLDRVTIIISIMVVAFFPARCAWVLLFVPDMNIYGQVSMAIGLLVIAGSFFLYPTGYLVNEKAVVVKGVVFSRAILKQDIIAVELVKTEDMSSTIRAFGSGGFFGYFGLFYNAKYKWMIWFVTQRKNYVLVHTAKRKFVFTPDNPEGFLAALN
jgi:hypothetical protein